VKPTGTNQESVDRILLREGSLKELKPFFGNREEILAYHARRMSEIFSADRKVTDCESCNRRSAETGAAFLWRGIYHTAGTVVGTIIGIATAMGGHGILPHRRIDFVTTHGFCSECFRKIRRQRVLAAIGEKFCFIVTIISVIVFVPVLVFTPVFLYPKPTLPAVEIIITGLGGGLIGLVGGLSGADKVVGWCVPKSLKFISKRPFRLIGVQKR
jgi:hypothetical protein